MMLIKDHRTGRLIVGSLELTKSGTTLLMSGAVEVTRWKNLPADKLVPDRFEVLDNDYKKRGRPYLSEEPVVRVFVGIPSSVVNMIDDLAGTKKGSRQNFIRSAINKELKRRGRA